MRITGDFKDLDKKYENGEITFDDYQELFAKSRLHGLDNSIYPFAVGGSDAGTILGHSKYGTPLMLYKEKMGIIPPPKISGDNDEILFIGHIFEDPFRMLFEYREPLCYKAYPFQKQMASEEYPHCLANIDGLAVMHNEESGKNELWLYEGKTTQSDEYKELFRKGKAPISYVLQTYFYMGVIDEFSKEIVDEIDPKLYMILDDFEIKGAIINCGWGLKSYEMKQVYIKRSKEFEKEILDSCESFVLDAEKGKEPTNRVVSHPILFKKEHYKNFGEVTKGTAYIDKKYIKVFDEISRLEEQEAKIGEELKKKEEELKPILEKYKPVETEAKEIEKTKEELYGILLGEAKGKPEVIIETEDTIYKGSFKIKTSYSMRAAVKKYWEENYPESFKDVTSLEVSNKVSQGKIEKIEK